MPTSRPEAPTRDVLPGRRHVIAGLFSGIGGFELGFARSGHETALLCEIKPDTAAILRDRFPGIPMHNDVRTLKGLPTEVDLVTAGFPCQDLSPAGKTAGIQGDRSGLVREVFRLIHKHRVSTVVLENVPFMLRLDSGKAMDVIASTFEAMGYAWAYRTVDALAFGRPQRRERVYFVASCELDPREVLFADETGGPSAAPDWTTVACGFYWTEGLRGLGWAVDAVPPLKSRRPAIVLPDGRIVTPDIRDAERLQGFEADWTTAPRTQPRINHRWESVGNAVSVEAATWLGRRIGVPGPVLALEEWPLQAGAAWPSAAYNIGQGRVGVAASTYPVAVHQVGLGEFLMYEPAPLSLRATLGFLDRCGRGSLRFPSGFLEKIEAHARRLR